MSTAYYRLTTRDGETSGTPDAIRASVRLYLAGGKTGFWITGPFSSPPAYRSPEQRHSPVFDDRLCASCFHPYRSHVLGASADGTRCPACRDCPKEQS
jgi:hypothetical protein